MMEAIQLLNFHAPKILRTLGLMEAQSAGHRQARCSEISGAGQKSRHRRQGVG
jgi:hypothetical protein